MTAPAQRHDPDVLVIGGGVAGLFCAYHLRLRGVSVAVVERGAIGGPWSCSSGNTGFVGTQGAAPLAGPGMFTDGLPFSVRPRLDRELVSWLWHFRRACNQQAAQAGFRVLLDLKRRSLEILRELCSSGGLAATFTERGMIVAFKTPQGFDEACRSMPAAVASGVPLRELSLAELHALEPGVEFDIHGALFNGEGAYLRVPEFVREFAHRLKDIGVGIHPHGEVTGFEAENGTVTQVMTTRGDFKPREVVIAAGAWSAQCAGMLGIGLKLQPAKGYTITVSTPRNAPRLPVLLGEAKVAICPLGDRLRFGGTMELSRMDGTVSSARVDYLRHTVQSYLPRLEESETLETWSGFRPCTPDSLPFMGRAPRYRNLTVACGHGHIGLGLAPAGGRLVAQIVVGEQPDVDISPFRVNRYSWRKS